MKFVTIKFNGARYYCRFWKGVWTAKKLGSHAGWFDLGEKLAKLASRRLADKQYMDAPPTRAEVVASWGIQS